MSQPELPGSAGAVTSCDDSHQGFVPKPIRRTVDHATTPPVILLVEDNEADVRLIQEAFHEAKLDYHLLVARDGVEAMKALHGIGLLGGQPRPALVLLDLNLPLKDGRQVLAEMKHDPNLQRIPVVVLTTSIAARDVQACYDQRANCYVRKPLERFASHRSV